MDLKNKVLQLSKEEKIQLLETIWEDLNRDTEIAPPDWHQTELDKTQSDLEQGRVKALDWEEVKRELMRERDEAH